MAATRRTSGSVVAGMLKATTCTLDGRELHVDEALMIPDRGASPPFRCRSCGERVRAHKRGTTGQAAHFEHLTANPACPLSARS